ncbi:MAG: ROK family transcriptional regulator [Christensenellaceae bacterium]|nr:ROK family transcriptional regulator [Christensenellaceae bacterium]
MTRQKAVSSEIRKINRNLIYHYLYDHPAVSKQELSNALNKSMPTITQNLTELIGQGLVVNTEPLQSTGGRKARTLSINPRAKHAIGLDVTAQNIGAVIVDLGGSIVVSKRIEAPFSSTEFYFKGLAMLIEELIDEAGIDRGTILGAGLAVPAIISKDGQELAYASFINFTKGQLRDFSEFIKYPCRFINDASAGGFAEFWTNAALRNSEGLGVAYLSVNNSVGGAFLVNGRIFEGDNQRASEFGHMTLIPGGRTCYCGQSGCVDAYLGAGRLTDGHGGSLRAFFESLADGNPASVVRWSEYTDYLALAINNLHMALDTDVIFGGHVGGFATPYIGPLREKIARKNPFSQSGAYLKDCAYKREATAVGAALLYISGFIKSI